MDRDALYADAYAYATKKISDAPVGSKGYTHWEKEQVITRLSYFLRNPDQLITEEAIRAKIDSIDAMDTPGPVNVLVAEALEHALSQYESSKSISSQHVR